jgi:hypothetical protein
MGILRNISTSNRTRPRFPGTFRERPGNLQGRKHIYIYMGGVRKERNIWGSPLRNRTPHLHLPAFPATYPLCTHAMRLRAWREVQSFLPPRSQTGDRRRRPRQYSTLLMHNCVCIPGRIHVPLFGTLPGGGVDRFCRIRLVSRMAPVQNYTPLGWGKA